MSTSATTVIMVSPSNSTVAVNVPVNGLVTLQEDTETQMNGFSIDTVNVAAAATIAMTVTARHGTVRLTYNGSLQVHEGDAHAASSTLKFSGSLSHVNSALTTLHFTPKKDFNGLWKNGGRAGYRGVVPASSLESLEVTAVATDNIDAKPLTPLATKSCMVSVEWVNDAPVISAPSVVSAKEDSDVALQPVKVTDVDASETIGGKIEVTVTASVGTVSLDTVAAARAALNFLDGVASGAPTLCRTPSPTGLSARPTPPPASLRCA